MPTPSPSDTQLIRTHGVNALRIPGVETAPLHLLGEQETLIPFVSSREPATLDSITLPTDLWKGKRVMVAPGYGNLPFQLLCLGAREVVGIDIDPITIAYQRKKMGLGKLQQNDIRLSMISTHRARMFYLDSLQHELTHNPRSRNEALKNISFAQHDLRTTLNESLGRFSLIVVPYLIGMNNGVGGNAASTVLQNLAARLTDDGAILVLPAEYHQRNGTIMRNPDVATFAEQHSFSIAYSKPYLFSMIVNPPGTRASYALLKRQ
jgi:hypothetical protein